MADFKVMDSKYITEQLKTVVKRINALTKEQETCMLERSIEITGILAALKLKEKSLRQRLENQKPVTGVMEHSIVQS